MSGLSMSLFFLATTLVLALVNRRAYRWLVSTFAPPPVVRRGLAVVLVASLAAMTLGRVVDRLYAEAPIETLLVVASTIQLTVLMSVVMLLAVDGIQLGAAVWRRVRSQRATAAPGAPIEPSEEAAPQIVAALPRRAFLTQAGVWDDKKEEELKVTCAQEVDAAVEQYLQTPKQSTDAMFDFLFANVPQTTQDQRDMARRYAASSGH